MLKRGLIYGGAIAAAGAALTAVISAAGLQPTEGAGQLVGLLGLLFPVVGIVLAIRAAKRAETGEFTFGDGFKQGLVVSAVAALLSAVLTYLYVTVIDPDYLETVRAATEAQLRAQGYSAREIARTQAATGGMTTPGAASLIGGITQFVLGLVISALAALFMRRKADPAQYQ